MMAVMPMKQGEARLAFIDVPYTILLEEMIKGRNKPRRPGNEPTPKDQARDELFQHIIRCEVVGCDPEHQREWFDETMRYFSERYHELSAVDVAELRTLGERFAQPPRTAASALVNEQVVVTA